MPKRPREHQLESESRTAFERALGSGFVVRDINPDYGLDVEVEEFDAEGSATGLRFYVQLKATDETNVANALTVRLGLDAETYYRSLPLPVLMVRYHAPTEALYVRWFHSYDPHYDGERTQKALPFRWRHQDAWTSETAARLVAEARAFLRFRQPFVSTPISAFVEVDAAYPHGLTETEILYALQGAASRSPGVVQIARGPAPAGEVAIRIASSAVTFDVQGVGNATFHYDDSFEPGDGGERLAADALALGALALGQFGQIDLASRFAAAFVPGSSLVTNPDALWELSSEMAASHRIMDALTLAQRLDALGSDDGHAAAFIFITAALFRAPEMTEVEAAEFLRVFEARVARVKARGDSRRIANANYTLANFYRTRGRVREAIRHYRRAIQLDREYRDRGYFWGEIGGALFGRGRYPDAAAAYKRATDLGVPTRVKALYADALAHAGQYREARAALQEYLEEDPDAAPYWYLKQGLLATIIEKIADRQKRAPEHAGAIVEKAIAIDDPRETARLLDDALAADALSAVAWFNYGYAARQLGDDTQLTAYLAAAVLQTWDVEAWVNAIMLGSMHGVDQGFFSAIVAAAHQEAGDAVKRQLVTFLRQQPSEIDREAILRAYDETVAQVPPGRDDPLTVRFFGDDGRAEVIELSRS
jgi:tetratricopeptide (TPR) repeat protein